MQVTEFSGEPTSKKHPQYESSMFSTTAPEWATGEVLLASTYRRLLLGIGEAGIDTTNIDKVRDAMPPIVGGPEVWSKLLIDRGGIESPLCHGSHTSVGARQLMPIIPSIGHIAGVLGRPRSRWNPSNLLLETIGAGVGYENGLALICQLGHSLSVTTEDDIFARFSESSLQLGLEGIGQNAIGSLPYTDIELADSELCAFRFGASSNPLNPAERFCKDLKSVIELKDKLTRRQWTVFVESVLRIGLGMHVLWTCNANIILWDLIISVASGSAPPTIAEIENYIWKIREPQVFLELGSNPEPLIERMIERYAYARTGINLLLCRLDDAGVSWPESECIGYSKLTQSPAPKVIAKFLNHIFTNRQAIDALDAGKWLLSQVGKLFDDRKDLRSLASCKSGYSKNLKEFFRHSLGQINAMNPEQRCYDLAYLFAFSGRKKLCVQPGAAMLIMLVNACCVENPSIPVSLENFRYHLGTYGIHVPAGELISGRTGRDLAMLGLIMDSPDAAGGRLLVSPF